MVPINSQVVPPIVFYHSSLELERATLVTYPQHITA
jgi:hypothetical protein